VRVANAGGEFTERARRASVAIGPEEDFARPRVPFFRQGDVADALVAGLGRIAIRRRHAVAVEEIGIVVVANPLLAHEVAEDIHVAMSHLVGGENVVVWNDDDLVRIPNLGVLAEVLLEYANGPRPADIMRHKDVGVDPDIVARLHMLARGGAGE